jgi:hypothetical protein
LSAAALFRDYTIALWLLKLGGLLNLYLLASTIVLAKGDADAYIVFPAQIFLAVSAYRCFFPVSYVNNIVFHKSIFSSIFVTRLFATFSEIAYVFLFSHVLRVLNINHVELLSVVSWLMTAQVVISQIFVWSAILTGELDLYYYEELGWALIFVANTIASAYLYKTLDGLGGEKALLELSVLFGILYLPFEVIHLATLRASANRNRSKIGLGPNPASIRWAAGLKRAVRLKIRRTDANAWGGLIGLTWMTGYWATLLPMWVYYIVEVFHPHASR